jgi:integrase
VDGVSGIWHCKSHALETLFPLGKQGAVAAGVAPLFGQDATFSSDVKIVSVLATVRTGIRRVKGAKRLGVSVGNWLTAEQGKRLLLTADGASLRSKRDYATLAILPGCGLRRAELTALRVEDIQQREEHWVIADLVGKGGHIRTIPVPDWVKAGIDTWMGAAGIATGTLLLRQGLSF